MRPSFRSGSPASAPPRVCRHRVSPDGGRIPSRILLNGLFLFSDSQGFRQYVCPTNAGGCLCPPWSRGLVGEDSATPGHAARPELSRASQAPSCGSRGAFSALGQG